MESNRSLRDYLLIAVKGMAMGAADVVPGVSGGTIALITGIYNELLHSLRNCGPATLPILFKQGFPAAWKHINGFFLLAVFGGILISIKTFASVISYCLENYPLLVWGFFSGLITASVILLAKTQSGWKWQHFLWCVLGVAVVVGISVAKPAQLPGEPWVLFFGGFIAICAMILPGISGSFILLLLGLYSVFLQAINNMDVIAIACFGAGCISGLLVFSRFLSWLLDTYYTPTMALLIGFLIGSLNVTWPWKHVLETVTDRHGDLIPVVQKNVLPWDYSVITGQNSQLLYVILCVALGVALVLLTEFVARSLMSDSSN